mmetsp:Transcript_24448/g.63072  ORF Transcript_24448/g.63072 Transcript_24448/m.63072 type:complete len:112 (+) Transcript_24448:248-583(+)
MLCLAAMNWLQHPPACPDRTCLCAPPLEPSTTVICLQAGTHFSRKQLNCVAQMPLQSQTVHLHSKAWDSRLFSANVFLSLIDVGRASSAYVVFLFFPKLCMPAQPRTLASS